MRGSFHRLVVSQLEENGDAEALAYASLEEARLRIEALHSCMPHGSDAQAESDLDSCHRHLGLAGFHCCADLRSGPRLRWLALAHDRLRVDERDTVRGSLDSIVRATDAVELALIATGLGDHVRAAHGHVLAACDSFAAYLQVATPA